MFQTGKIQGQPTKQKPFLNTDQLLNTSESSNLQIIETVLRPSSESDSIKSNQSKPRPITKPKPKSKSQVVSKYYLQQINGCLEH